MTVPTPEEVEREIERARKCTHGRNCAHYKTHHEASLRKMADALWAELKREPMPELPFNDDGELHESDGRVYTRVDAIKLTNVKSDTAEMRRINERFEVLLVQRELLVADVLDIDGTRLERLSEIEAEAKVLRERSLMLSACIDIARATTDNEEE